MDLAREWGSWFRTLAERKGREKEDAQRGWERGKGWIQELIKADKCQGEWRGRSGRDGAALTVSI